MRKHSLIAAVVATATCAGCSSVPLKEAGTLSDYNGLGPVVGRQAKLRTYLNATQLANVTTIVIAPTQFSEEAAAKISSKEDRKLVTNAIDRSLCVGLSDGYQLVRTKENADLLLRITVTDIVKTDKVIAGVSTATSLGTRLLLPVGVPRLPFGLGGLAVEGEAVDATGRQQAAIVWSLGANSLTSPARVSEIGDAYSLASAFGNDFSRMLVAKQSRPGFKLPSAQRIQSSLGGKPKHSACEVFGRSPGVVGIISGRVGVSPRWIEDAGS
ncbi:DUF3313 domain-containing protein [Rhizobium bangladeshense]|uniref:DUF3313 domain-containing protein n=1 Tax=Rhizobium bangladeshense TaxID=1138189 RepID=UPI001C82CCA9|nr:DUF3313 domain-containing protein [Rhizobium bangladeshense]MBX4898727.1 DUF3313 domain-containing protein [Rhizobium bangladeshense]MBY3616750.1 DUF3313 domain-containing protein [Rhizobium bangladeshense]